MKEVNCSSDEEWGGVFGSESVNSPAYLLNKVHVTFVNSR